ncbi:MAG: hypothetical protein ACJASY_002352 [Halioglobus sp.]
MSYRIRHFDSYAELPESYENLLAVAVSQGFFSQQEWFEFLIRHFYVGNQTLRLYSVEDIVTGKPLLLSPMRWNPSDPAVPRALALATLGHSENYAAACFLVDPAAETKRQELLTTLFKWLRDSDEDHSPGRVEVMRLAPLANRSPLGLDVLTALQNAGYLVQIYANSYNQYEECAGLDYQAYLAGRSSNQRYNSRRRRRNLEKKGELTFSILTNDSNPGALRSAIDEYIMVSIHCWKSRESTIDRFILDWMQLAAAQGCLRLGVLKLGDKAIAAQFWLLSGGVASMIRVNFDESFRDLAPGVVLSNLMIEHLLDVDRAESLDFGYGGEEYKGRWVGESRGYSGIMAFNPSTVRGFYYGIKHIFGQYIKRRIDRGRVTLQSRGAV